MIPRMLHIARAGNAFQSGLARGQCQYADPTSKHGGSFGKARAKFGVSATESTGQASPPGIRAGVNQYEQLYGDPLKWLRESWIDYHSAATLLARWRTTQSFSFAAALVALSRRQIRTACPFGRAWRWID